MLRSLVQNTSVHQPRIAVIIPCFRAKKTISQVIEKFAPLATKIYVVEDGCPEASCDGMEDHFPQNVEVIRNQTNLGVGGATLFGMRAALNEQMEILVKVDADDQMDPAYFHELVYPLLTGEAQYAKGNRFFHIAYTRKMPRFRLFGNAMLSFLAKLMSGYWNLTDPTNGYIAIRAHLLRKMDLDKIDSRYFFEMDMIFRLSLLHGTICEVPMPSRYFGEHSSLSIQKIILEFPPKIFKRVLKRMFYGYFLREFNPGTIALLGAFLLLSFGLSFGGYHWILSTMAGKLASSGTVMIAALSTLLGFQFFFYFLQYDTLKNSHHSFVRDIQALEEGRPLHLL